jgi:hypothetical protein
VTHWFRRILRKRCPTCGQRSLVFRNGFLATVVVDGKRAPDSWYYYECSACGARLKSHLHRDFVSATDVEWDRDVTQRLSREQ